MDGNLYSAQRVALYDVSLPLEDRSKNRLEFESIHKASAFLGYTPAGLADRLKNKHIATHRTTKKKYAVRAIK